MTLSQILLAIVLGIMLAPIVGMCLALIYIAIREMYNIMKALLDNE